MQDLLNAVLLDPVLQHTAIKKCFYLRTETCSKGGENTLLQPGNDTASLAAMNREIMAIYVNLSLLEQVH